MILIELMDEGVSSSLQRGKLRLKCDKRGGIIDVISLSLSLLPPVIPDDMWLKVEDISHILLPVYMCKVTKQ